MKRIVVLLGFGLVCISAAYYAAPRYVSARKTADQNAAYARIMAKNGPLVLNPMTQAILSGADRVETFRLEDDEEDEDEPDYAALQGPHAQYLDGHRVLHVGPEQGKTFAAALQAMLAQAPAPSEEGVPGDFMPGIGFRIWKGDAHVDVCASPVSNTLQVCAKDAHHKFLQQTMTTLGLSRPAFFTLSEQAFPKDSDYLRRLEQL